MHHANLITIVLHWKTEPVIYKNVFFFLDFETTCHH